MSRVASLARPTGAALAAAWAALVASSGDAQAAPCSDLPNPIHSNGGGKEVTAGLAQALASQGITLVYKSQGSCLAVDSILNGTPLPDTAVYWAGATETDCELGIGTIAHIGTSDVFATTCGGLPNGLPDNVGDYLGPVQPYLFVVPKASTQKVISAAAGYFVYGFGSASGVDPWTDAAFIFHRGSGASGTQQLIGLAIGVPPDTFLGTATASSGDMVTAVKDAPEPEKAIGILTSQVADEQRLYLSILAYQASDQSCGYWPDSTQTGEDKQNVRDGHYSIWAPLHFFTKLDSQGYPIDKDAGDVIAYLTGTKEAPGGLDLIALEAASHTVPQCAMRVSRTSELGPMSSFLPTRSCSCYFDSLVSKTDCTSCTSSVQCPDDAPVCNFGYCEPQ